jgi:hypothetical protein
MNLFSARFWKLLRSLPVSRRHSESNDVVRAAVLQLEYDTSLRNNRVFTDFFISLLSKISSFMPHVVVFPALTDLFFVSSIWFVPLFKRFLKNKLNVPEVVTQQCEWFMAEVSRRMRCIVAFGTVHGLKLYNEGQFIEEKRVSVKDRGLALVPKRWLTNSEVLSSLVEDGIRIVVTPTCGSNVYNEWDDKYYFWSHAQMVGFYGLKATLVGRVAQNRLKDKACVCGPIPITQNRDGYIVRNESLEGSAVLLAELDMGKLENFLAEQRHRFNSVIR